MQPTTTNTPDVKTSAIDTLPFREVVLRIADLLKPLSPDDRAELDQLLDRARYLYRRQFGFCISCGQQWPQELDQ